MLSSSLEYELLLLIKYYKLKLPILQFKFHQKRKWRCDFGWPEEKLICEVEGGVWINGRHTRATGFIKDCEKYNELALLGFRLIRVTENHIKNGKAIDWIKRGLK